jgi:diguanylate cyclase (GGDEF)-like protein
MAVLIVTIDTSGALATRGREGEAPAAADELRRQVADALSRNTRGGDLVGRLADDEFVVLLPDTQPAEARAAADRLRDAIAAVLAPREGDGRRPTSFAAIGIAIAPGHGDTPERLFAAARDSVAHAVIRRHTAA